MDTSLVEVEYDEQTKKKLIIQNWIKMLYNRNWLQEDLDNHILYALNKYEQLGSNDMTYVKYNGKKYILFLILRKVTSITKEEDIKDYLDKYKSDYKFFVFSKLFTKVDKKLQEYDNTEVFLDEELIVNIVDNFLVPKHIVLSTEEGEQFLKEYKVKKSNLMRIFSTDPIARYYNIRPGQIVKIIRPSITAGEEIAFRVCVSGKII